MSRVAVLGAGAFGTALAITLSRSGRRVTLWAREGAGTMEKTRQSGPRLPGFDLPDSLSVTGDLGAAAADVQLICVPMQALVDFLAEPRAATAPTLVACMKGIDLRTGEGPSAVIARLRPEAAPAVLTGPSFSADIASGLPTALTLACSDDTLGKSLQDRLSTPSLRLYRSTDTIGAELGGALKNVVALAAGIAIGAGLGDSARAALIARGMAEIARIATHFGADPPTLMGLSGLGDLVLTATSEKSRNFAAGLAIGSGAPLPSATTEGIATAAAMAGIAARDRIDAPIIATVARITTGDLAVADAIDTLLARPLKEE
ncbi:MAG: NAD(P)H-dependent glycerol-3-phosphate dehydrogenase [Paracoccaceae bacterium]|nr:NAD(P)H-dependent glycerol-3-phosphate dehydrogenase [Paracoccaceae bacterium]